MKNITVSLDDDTCLRARIRAAECDTSVSALVKAFLTDLAQTESESTRLRREQQRLRELVEPFTAGTDSVGTICTPAR